MLVYIEHEQGEIKKSSLELLSYAAAFEGEKVIAVVINCPSIAELHNYGATEIITISTPELDIFNAKAYAATLAELAKVKNEKYVLVSSSPNAKYFAPLLAIDLQGEYLPNITSLPTHQGVVQHIFSNRLMQYTLLPQGNAVLGLATNAFGLHQTDVVATESSFTPSLSEEYFKVKQKAIRLHEHKVSISEASVVVSGGRGLQGSHNWHLIENLAQTLGGATACSKPVSDMGWRPHSEHVGQTGQTVASNLYIAVGISGAIQHLAGVKASKVKVVINSDPEAPFFKEADYGIVGDLFEILPILTEKLKQKLA